MADVRPRVCIPFGHVRSFFDHVLMLVKRSSRILYSFFSVHSVCEDCLGLARSGWESVDFRASIIIHILICLVFKTVCSQNGRVKL